MEKIAIPKIELAPSPLARRLLDILPKMSGNKILEIGANETDIKGEHSGDDCTYLASHDNQITLVGSGEGVTEEVRKRTKEFGVDSRVEFLIENPEKLNLPSNYYDAALSLAGLDGTYLPDSLKEIGRVLKPWAKALILIYYKSGGQLMQGPRDELKAYILQSGLWIDSEQIRVIDELKGLETIIFELHKLPDPRKPERMLKDM